MMKNLMRSRGWGVLPLCSPTERCTALSHSLALRNTSTSLGSKGTSELQSSSLRDTWEQMGWEAAGGGGRGFEIVVISCVIWASLFKHAKLFGVYSLPRLQRLHINEPLKGGHERLQPLLQIAHIFLQGGGKDSCQPGAHRHAAKLSWMHGSVECARETKPNICDTPLWIKNIKETDTEWTRFFFFATGCCKVRNTQAKTTIASFSTQCSTFKNSSGHPKQAVSLYLSLFPSLWRV